MIHEWVGASKVEQNTKNMGISKRFLTFRSTQEDLI